MNDYLGQTKWEWAHQRRVSPWPLLRLVLVVFCLGVGIGVALSFAFSVLSASPSQGSFRPDQSADLVDVGSTVRASLASRNGPVSSASSLGQDAISPSGDHYTVAPASAEGAYLLQRGEAPRTTSLAHTSTVIEPIAQSIEQIITNAAIEFGVSPAWLLRVARCESGPNLDVNAIGDGGRSLSILQYQARTFLEHARDSGLGYDLTDLTDPVAQSRTAAWAFANGRSQAWTCAR